MSGLKVGKAPIYASSLGIKFSRSGGLTRIAMYITEIETPYKLQYLVTPDKFKQINKTNSEGISYPKTLTRCHNAETTPQRKTVLSLGKYVPCAEKWFYMPVWEILRNRIKSEKYLEKLAFKIKHKLMLHRVIDDFRGNCFTIRTNRLKQTINYLVKQSTFDSLSALTVLLAKSEFDLNPKYKSSLMEAIDEVLINLSVYYEVEDQFYRLHKMFSKRFKYSWNLKVSCSKASKIEDFDFNKNFLSCINGYDVRYQILLRLRKHLGEFGYFQEYMDIINFMRWYIDVTDIFIQLEHYETFDLDVDSYHSMVSFHVMAYYEVML